MKDYARIASRLFNTPIMLRPEKAEMLIAVLAERLGIARLDRMDASAMTATEFNQMSAAGRDEADGRPRRNYELVDGVAFIPIEGTLVHKSGWIGPSSGMTGYDGIVTQLREAMADEEVRGIWLDIDSPGGETNGNFDLTDEIFASNKANGGKPIWAMVNEQATSAAYCIASAADKVFSPRTGIVGSIGVYILYVDQTKALTKDGLAVEFIRSGERKARGNGLEPRDAEAMAKYQALVDESRDIFARTVARNRGVSVKSIMETEGDWYSAPEGLARGLIDGILSEVEAFAKFQRHLNRAAKT